jgi:glycosyltransferase involved in cell wall biosynthesis
MMSEGKAEHGSGVSGLSIVIPVYNEEAAIRDVIQGIHAAGIKSGFEVLVVDDGSEDRTPEILAAEAEAGRVRHIRSESNRGYGAALKTGIHAARSDRVIILDGDGTYPLEHFNDLYDLSDQYEMVVGNRTGPLVDEPLLRRTAKWVVRRLLKFLAGIDIPDLNSGLRLFRKSMVQKYMNILPDGLSFTSTLTLIALSEGLPVKYIPINYHARKGRSKFHPINDTLNLLILIMRTILYFNPLKIFIPLSLFLALIAVAVALFSTLYLDKFMDVTTVVILLAAVQVFILGLLADLITKVKK